MGKLFGTDGIRGVVNQSLDAPLAYRVGQAAAVVLGQNNQHRPCVVVGRDTRIFRRSAGRGADCRPFVPVVQMSSPWG